MKLTMDLDCFQLFNLTVIRNLQANTFCSGKSFYGPHANLLASWSPGIVGCGAGLIPGGSAIFTSVCDREEFG